MTDEELRTISNMLDRFSETRSIEAQMNELLLNYGKRLLAEVRSLRNTTVAPKIRVNTNIPELKSNHKKHVLIMNSKHRGNVLHVDTQTQNCKKQVPGFALERIIYDERVPEDETKVVLSKDWFFHNQKVQAELDGKPYKDLDYKHRGEY